MNTYKTKTTVEKNHVVKLYNLPFEEGEVIEIMINPVSDKNHSNYELWGTPYEFIDPLEPAINPNDWEINSDSD
jgi:hypothetical protein